MLLCFCQQYLLISMICAAVNLNTIIMMVGINKMHAKVCRRLMIIIQILSS